MASEIRVNQINNRSGLSTVTFSDTGVIISGITTISDGRFSQDIVVNSVNIGCGGISTQTVVVGAGAGTSGPGSQNVFVGAGAGRSVTSAAYRNTVVGFQAMYNNDIGPTNTAIGYQALYSLNGYTYYNTAVGRYALGSLTSGVANIAMGHNSGASVTTGSGNVCINSGGPTTGSSNVWISGAGSTAGSSNILIGGNITASTGTESYNVILGGVTAAGGINNNIIIGDGQGNERLRVDSSGNTGIGITNPGAKLHVAAGNIKVDSGYGIDFSATANSSGTMTSELLSDYEVGTFTPTITNDGFTRTYNGTYTAGKYTKIGNTVHIEVHIYVSAQSGSNNGGSPRINLPFVQSQLAPSVRWNHNILRLAGVLNSEINKLPCAHLTTNQSGYIELCYQNDGTATSTDTPVNTSGWFGGAGNYQIGFSAVYKTDS